MVAEAGFEPAASGLSLRASCGAQNSLRLGAPMNFDRCAILALLYPPQAALRRRCPARGFGVVTFG